MQIDFIDLKTQQAKIKPEIDKRIAAVMSHGRYILGPEVMELEKNLCNFSEAKHALTCANGTDAIILALMAWGIGPGDAVICPSFTYCATAEAVAIVGAVPVLVDIDRDSYNIESQSIKQAILDVSKNLDLKLKAIMAVDLFGQSSDYRILSNIAKTEDIKLIADSAQGFGTTLDNRHPVYWADIATTSFFPAKPLGCYGDGGAILTNDAETASIIDSIRVHGRGEDKYDNIRIGLNSRLDTLQAAIILPKLEIFSEEIIKRNVAAKRYIEMLSSDHVKVPTVPSDIVSTWAQFCIEVSDPIGLAAYLKTKGIPTARYYPKAVHMQTAYKHFPVVSSGLDNTEDCSQYILAIPMHPYLEGETQEKISQEILKFVSSV